MSAGKIVLLVVYVVLAALMLTQAGTGLGIWSGRLLMLLVAVHLIEVVVFFKLCQRAGGSLVGHVIQVFLFGILHANELKAKLGEA